jgi:site-specific DNA-methyltransferase (adenine-specific)
MRDLLCQDAAPAGATLPKPFYQDDLVTLFYADNRDVLPYFSNHFTAVVPDPPYGLSFMGKGWDKGVPGLEFWGIISAACKPGAPLLAFGGDRTHHRLMCAIEDAGWEIRTCLYWIFGSGFPKSLDVSKAIDRAKGEQREVVGSYTTHDIRANGLMDRKGGMTVSVTAPSSDLARLWSGYGTALKPAAEIITLAMKPLDGTFAGIAEKWGVAGLNVDGGRIGTTELTGKIYRNSGANLTWGGTYGKGTVEGNSIGRFPANVLLDEEAAALLDEQSGVLSSGDLLPHHRGQGTSKIGTFNIRDRQGEDRPSYGDSGGASRFFYTGKASKADRGKGNNHPTVKPIKLMQYLIRLVTMPQGTIILDPFAGSGRTLLAAKWLGIKAVGIELEEANCEILARQLQEELPL